VRRLAALAALSCSAAASAHGGDAALWLTLDKPAQHSAGIRTACAVAVRPTVRLPATVVADPRHELRLAAPQDGVVEPQDGALPLPGEAVKAGQLLAWLRPVLAQPERRDLDVDLSNTQRDMQLGRLQIDRYGIDENQHLEIKLPTPSIEIVANYRSAVARSGALNQALQRPIPLRAPRAGVVLRSPAAGGRIAAAGELLFDLDGQAGLAVAMEYDDADIDAAAVQHADTLDRRSLGLHLLGVTVDPVLRSRRALYAADDEAGLAVNQLLLVEAPRALPAAVLLPATAVFRHGGRDWVWLHPQADRFMALPVRVGARDAEQLRVDGGLGGGERVVTRGADFLLARAEAAEQAHDDD